MSAVAIVTAKLLASPDVVEVVGDKIFPIQAPQSTPRPFITLHIIDNDDTPTLSGAGRYYRTIIQADLLSEMTPAGATQVIELGDAVIDTLNGVVKERIAGCTDVDVLLGSADMTESDYDANTHRRLIQFSVRWRRQIGQPSEEPTGVLAFSITAGSGSGAIGYVGANHYAGWAPFGSLSAEPMPDHPLVSCTSHPTFGSIVAFAGDISATLAGKHVWVNGVDYGPGVQYAWVAAAGVTLWNIHTGGPVFVAGEAYAIEIK